MLKNTPSSSQGLFIGDYRLYSQTNCSGTKVSGHYMRTYWKTKIPFNPNTPIAADPSYTVLHWTLLLGTSRHKLTVLHLSGHNHLQHRKWPSRFPPQTGQRLSPSFFVTTGWDYLGHNMRMLAVYQHSHCSCTELYRDTLSITAGHKSSTCDNVSPFWPFTAPRQFLTIQFPCIAGKM